MKTSYVHLKQCKKYQVFSLFKYSLLDLSKPGMLLNKTFIVKFSN